MTWKLIVMAVLTAALATSGSAASTGPEPKQKIAFSSTRDNLALTPLNGAEIYLMNPDGSGVSRLTANDAGDGLPAIAPDGSGRIVFDSNRRRTAPEAANTSDLFRMNVNGTAQTFLTRGSSATWSPDAAQIAFHASASGSGTPIKADPGAATSDSDIFVLNLASGERVNITHDPAVIDDDPDWGPDGETIAFTSHPVTDAAADSVHAEIYLINRGGTEPRVRVTNNLEEERGPDWSPDGTKILFACRRGGTDFEICVMNADGTNQRQLTDNPVADLTPGWAPDGQHIVFHHFVSPGGLQLSVMNPDGTGQTPLTATPGMSLFANWGRVEAVPPEVVCEGPDGAWHGSDVSLACTASDAGSGLASASDASFSLATAVPDGIEVADAATASRRICDMAGNCADAGPIGGNMIDKKAPEISIGAPADGGTFLLGQFVAPDYACSDAGAGVAVCAGGVVDTSSVGTRLFTVEASDAVGNLASRSAGYAVGYAICVLYDQARAHKQNSTIPIRIQVCDAAGSNVSSPTVAVHAVGLRRLSDDAPGVVEDAGAANVDSDFRYDTSVGDSGGYIFNLNAGGLSTGTWALAFTAESDPTSHTVQFQVR